MDNPQLQLKLQSILRNLFLCLKTIRVKLLISYHLQLTLIRRRIDLTVNEYGYLTRIKDPSGRETEFWYTGTLLTKIIYSDKVTYTEYVYDNNKNLTSAIYNNGYKIVYTYYNAIDTEDPNARQAYRVNKVYEEGYNNITSIWDRGNELEISYGKNTTTFTDVVKGTKNIYQFNNYGNTVSIKDADGSAQYYKFLDQDAARMNKLSQQSKLQKTVINILKNHSAETTGSDWTLGGVGDSTGSGSFTTADKYIGNQSLMVNKTNTSGRHYYSQAVTLEKGKTYTLSGYVKTNNISNTGSKGAVLYATYQAASGAWPYHDSSYISGTNGWQRVEVTFTFPSDAPSTTVYIGAGIYGETGTVYFDAIQLEEGSAANRYNLLENPSLEGGSGVPTSWSKNSADPNDTIATNEKLFGSQSFKISGIYNTSKNLRQVVKVSGKSGDALVVSGWAKGDSVPLDPNAGRYFALDIGIKRTNGTYQWGVVNFNRDSSDWQYTSDVVIADSDYTEITYYVIYYNNENAVYFDGLQLYKEEFGTSYQYDSNGNVISTTSLANQNSTFEYTNNDLTKATDPKGNNFRYEYDTKHNMTKATSAENVVYSFTYDQATGNTLTAKVGDAALYTESTSTYTTNGNYIKTVTDSKGNTITYNYNETKGTLDSVVDPKSTTTTYGYDPNNDNLTSVSKTVDGQAVTNSYTYENDRIKAITHNGFNYTFGYDSLGNNKTVAVGSQNLITNDYEARTGKLLESTYGNTQKTGYQYDILDRIIARTYNGSVRFKYGYDGSGNLGYHEDLVNGVNYRYVYDLLDRLAKITDTNGNVINYEYDLNSNIIKTTDKIGQQVLSGYNLALNKPAVASSNEVSYLIPDKAVDGSCLTRWSSQYSDPQWIYVDLGQVMNINRVVLHWETAYGKAYDIQVSNDAASWTTVYSTENGDGGLDDIYLASPASGRYVRMYGRVRGYTAGYSLWDFEVYDDSPAITRYDYDKDSRIKDLWINSGGSVSYGYDIIGRLNNRTVKTGTAQYVTTYGYVPGTAQNSTTNRLSSITNNGYTRSYEYDANGNIIKATWPSGSFVEYQYNELNELKRENNQILNKTITYSYDAGGNITSKVEYPYTTGTPGTPTKTYSYVYGDANWKDKLTSFDGKAITYDAIGNPLAYDGYTFTWEEGRQLKSMAGNGQSISYKYNDAGIRTEKTVNGVTNKYRLVGDKVTHETNGTDNIYYTYDSTGDLVSMNLSGTEYYYIRSGQGDIIGLFDSAGAQVVSYSYDTWGKVISVTGTLAGTVGAKNPYRYRGYRYDTETQLYYLQSRYYNPEWGRFINADSLGGQVGTLLSHNVFAYVTNNPVNFEDPNGYSPWSWARKFYFQAGVYIAATIITIQTYISYKTSEIIGNVVGKVLGKVDATNLYRKMSADEALKTIKTGKLQPPIKGANSSKYLSQSLEKAQKFTNNGVAQRTKEVIVEFKMNPNYYKEIVQNSVNQVGSKGVDAVKFNYEGLGGTGLKNFGIPSSQLGKFNENILGVRIFAE